ncbi:hypothetical protein CEB3_c31620 [Peptococcaceae bacterium CEB3]|nr:hypothetical protein CEB3_c31620 [Peptococcaceae bacterium CEB3]
MGRIVPEFAKKEIRGGYGRVSAHFYPAKSGPELRAKGPRRAKAFRGLLLCAETLQKTLFKLSDESAYILANFTCGNPEIERYIKEDAIKDSKNGKGVTYIVTDINKTKLIAYYTLVSTGGWSLYSATPGQPESTVFRTL